MKLKSLTLITILYLCALPFIHAQEKNDKEPLTSVEQMPSYVGGEAELQKYLTESVNKYLNLATDTIKRRVDTQFVVEVDGSIKDCRLMPSLLDWDDDDKVLEILRSMPKWIPGRQNNIAVPVRIDLLVIFYTTRDKQIAMRDYTTGETLLQRGECAEALEYFRDAVEHNPTSVRTKLGYAAALNTLGKYEESIDIFAEQYKVDKSAFDSRAYSNWGEALLNLKQPEKAITQLEKAIKLDSTSTVVLHNWGIALYDLKRYDEALEKVEKVEALIARGKGDIKGTKRYTYTLWANIYLKKGNYPNAIANYKLALECDGNNKSTEELSSIIGRLLMQKDEYEEAINYFGKTIEINEHNITAYSNWAKCLIALDKKKEAITVLETALDVNPGTSVLTNMLSNLYTDTGQKKQGQKLLKEREQKYMEERQKKLIKMESDLIKLE